ncbi:unnamed protein product (macronuclear) [Paramecium tetraurelia]|uniref:Calpain catalytic domain-containing protein n=1 Tax=Paramecium tetraurelia TaxID=5888 RepID=A0BNI6_PARTE|nr:uncharacterized protein GSPATT00030741001 [Paramecium tetraurelia]CAK60103.1 unnamed protein product [Paramecium tetraurelia]|eukprot:XP_001427501.1 hypothetical protein (macronuclear) [Paramecium tetraurelia strain d4-2]
MGSEDQVLKALYKLAVQKPFRQVVQDFGRPTLAQVHFRKLIIQIDPSISITDCDRFYQKALIDHKSLVGLTVEILEKITENQEKVELVLSKQDLQTISAIIQNYRAKRLDIVRVFKFFDKNRDLSLEEREIKELIEFYHNSITPQGYQSLRNKIGNLKFSCDHLRQLFQQWEQIVDNQNKNPQQEQVKYTIRSQLEEKKKEDEVVPVPVPVEDVEQQEVKDDQVDFADFINIDLHITGAKELVQIREGLKKTKQTFVDKDFPASVRSLGMKFCQLSWKRMSDIFQNNLKMFNVDDSQDSRVGLGKWISHRDIKQGILGDCYFLSSISTIACRWPEVIKDLFISQRANKEKLYAVRLCLDGEWKVVVLDDFIPVNGQGNPAFSKNAGAEMWVALLEKAWAKMNIDYTDIEGGDPREVIKSITGGPTWIVFTNAADFKITITKMFRYEVCYDQWYFWIKSELYQLWFGAWTCIFIIEGEVTLLKIRNPWGNKEWNGDWSDGSSLWTEDLKEQVKFGKKEDDGIFFMEIKDFQRYFQAIFVGYFRKEYLYNSIKQMAKKTKTIQYDIDIPNDGEYYFTVHQEAIRRYKLNKDIKYEYSYVRILLAKNTGKGEYQFIDQKQQKDIEVHLGGQLTKGKYSVQIKIKWAVPTWNEHEYQFSVYGSEFLRPKQVPRDADLRKAVMLQVARENKNLQQLTTGLFCAMETVVSKGLGYFYYKNSSQKTFKLKNTLSNKQGVKFLKPEIGDNYLIELAPGEDKIVLYSLDPSGVAFTPKHQLVQ